MSGQVELTNHEMLILAILTESEMNKLEIRWKTVIPSDITTGEHFYHEELKIILKKLTTLDGE